MGIEQDIQQQQFKNEYQKAMVNILFTSHWVNEQLKPIFDAAGITAQQFNILRILRGANGPLSTLQIRQRMLDKMSDTSRIVDRLVTRQLVHKTTCAKDKRLVDVSITALGLLLLQKIDSSQQQMDKLLSNLSNTEAQTLNSLLDKIRQ